MNSRPISLNTGKLIYKLGKEDWEITNIKL